MYRELLDGLTKKGFKITFGEEGSGFLVLANSRAGGYYLGISLPYIAFLWHLTNSINRRGRESNDYRR
jgi:hypothetical protein